MQLSVPPLAGLSILVAATIVAAETGTTLPGHEHHSSPIDTEFLQRQWPRQRVRELEVGRYPVRWRERASRKEGIFAGVRFEAPLERRAVWELSNDYNDVGHNVPGVVAVRYLERSETHEVIQIDAKVLWKKLTLNFEVEKEPPRIIRFRLVNAALGEYRGICSYEEQPTSVTGQPVGTTVELTTWLKPARPVPMGLLLMVERMALLQGVREFLKACAQHQTAGSRL